MTGVTMRITAFFGFNVVYFRDSVKMEAVSSTETSSSDVRTHKTVLSNISLLQLLTFRVLFLFRTPFRRPGFDSVLRLGPVDRVSPYLRR
jgi:hypothetical protein